MSLAHKHCSPELQSAVQLLISCLSETHLEASQAHALWAAERLSVQLLEISFETADKPGAPTAACPETHGSQRSRAMLCLQRVRLSQCSANETKVSTASLYKASLPGSMPCCVSSGVVFRKADLPLEATTHALTKCLHWSTVLLQCT